MHLSLIVAMAGIPAVALYVMLFGLLLPGEWSIYAFIAATFLFPDYGNNYFGFGDVPAYFFLEVVGALTILLAASRTSVPAAEREPQRYERTIVGILAATVIVHYVVYWPLWVAGYYPSGPALLSVVTHGAEMLVSLVFLYGCLRFIATLAQVDIVAWIFILCGVELLVERFAFGTMGLVPSVGRYAFAPPVGANTVQVLGPFKSLTENDPLAVGVFASVAMLCALYFAIRKKHPVAMALIVPFWLLAFTTYQRTFAVAPLAGACFFVWHAAGRRVRAAIVTMAVVALAVVVLHSGQVTGRLRSLYIGTWRDSGPEAITLNPWSTDQLYARWGIQARALDTFVDFFPFGTGEFVQRDYLASAAVRSRFQPPVTLVEAARNYNDAEFGTKATEVHNGYLEHIVAYGVLGVAGLVLFLGAIVANYRGVPRSLRVPQGLAYSALVFFGVFFMFYSFPKAYVGYFFFFHATFLLRRNVTASV